MSEKVGNISFYDSTGQMDYNFTKPYSEKTAEIIDKEAKDIIDESYERAKEVLKKHMKGLTELAQLLLEKEVIFGEDLERIFGKRKGDKSREKGLVPETAALKPGLTAGETKAAVTVEKNPKKKKDGKSSGKAKVKDKEKEKEK
jgi:cell division protease FtsH